jgi:hypothetical protein
MGLFNFFSSNKRVVIPQIGKLTYLNDKKGGILAGKAQDERVGYLYEVYFYVHSQELLSGQLEMYTELLNQFEEIVKEIKRKMNLKPEDSIQLLRLLISEPEDDRFDADLSFLISSDEVSILIKDQNILDIRIH